MWKSHEFFNIHTIVENLSIKYQELESSYYSFLRKSHKENERILQQEANLTSQFFHNLLREQSLLESNIKQLANEGQVFNDQISQLKAILSQEQSSPTENGDPFKTYNHYLNTKFNSLKTKVLSIPEFDGLEMSVLEKIDFHFQEAIEDVNATFSQLSEFNKESVGQTFDWRRIEEVINTNLPSFTGLEISLNSIKAKVIKSFGDFDNFIVSYNKEASTLRETIDQIKSQIFSIAKDAKSDSFRPMSPGSRSRGGVDEASLSQQVRKNCTFVSQLLTDTISNEQNRNRLVNSVKEEMRTFRDDVKNQLHEISKHVLFLKGNNQRVTMTFEEEMKSKRSRSLQEDSPGSRTKSTTRTLKPNVSTSKSASALNEKKMNLLSPSKTPNSVLSVNSPLQAIIQNNNLKKHSHTVSGGEKFYHEHGFGSPLEPNGNENFAKDLRADYEIIFKSLGQKLGYLETSIKNLIVSSGKVASFFVNFSGEEELALRVYESDKRSLESSLTSFKAFVLHTYDGLKSGSLATRSVDQDNPRRKEQSPLSTFSIRSPMRIANEEDDKPILIEDSQEEDNKRASPGRKGDDKKKQFAINDFQNIDRSKKGVNRDSPLQGALSEEGRMNIRAMSAELTTLKSRYESVSLERDQLKKENTTLNGRLKASVDSSKYELTQRVEDLTVQKENLTKENLKLLKVVKKLHRKAEDRKKNLKQLFELMTEKEKELEQYKSGKGGSVETSSREEAVLKQQKLEKDIKKKEKELRKLEEDIAEKQKEVGSAGRTQDYGVYTAQIAELDSRKKKLENVLSGLSSDAGAEFDEIQEMISLLSRERDLMVDKARIARNDAENWSSQQKDTKYGSLRQEQGLKATIQQQEETIAVLETEKKELETKCQEFMSDIESAQEHKKKIEKNYNEEIRILTNKLQELNNYIQELETKNTQRLRGSLGSDKWKTAMGEDEIKEENKRLKLERETVVEALQGIIEDLEAEGYTNWDGYEALKKVWSTLLERMEEEKHSKPSYSSNRDQLGSYRSTEKGRDTARKEKAELEELIDNLKDDLKQTTDSNKKILSEVENLKQETNKYKTRSREYGDVLSRLRSNLEKHGWIERGYQNEDANQRVLLAVETVVSEYETLRKKKGDDLNPNRKRSDEPDSSRRLIVEKDKKIVDLNNELHETQERLSEIERTLIPSKEKIIKELREEVHGKNNEIHVLKNTIAGEKEKTILGLRDELSDKSKKIHDLQERLQNMIVINERKVPSDDTSETLQIYLEQNEQLRSEVAKINERLIGVNQHLDQMRQHNTQLMEEKKELEKLLQTNRKSSRDLNEPYESRGRDVQKLQSEKAELEKQVSQISSLLEGSKADVMRLGHENKSLHKELAATKERKNSLKEERTSTDQQITDLKDSLAHKTAALDRQAKELEQVKKDLRTAREQLDDLKAQDFNIKGHAEKVEEDLRRSEEKWLEMENTLEKVAREKEELSEQLTNLRTQVEEYESTLETKQKQLDGLKVTVKEIEHLREEIRTKTDELTRSQTKVTELERGREELLEKVKDLKKEKEIGEAHAENLSEVRGKILEYEVKIGEMKDEARTAQSQKERLMKETEQLRDAYNRLQARLDEKENSIGEKGREKEDIERKYEKLQREHEGLVLELDFKKRDFEDKEKEVEKIEKQYSSLKEEFINVKNELQRTSQNLGVREKELSDKETQYKKIESQYSQLQSQFEERSRALEARNIEYNKLRDEHERVGADAEKGKHASTTLERQLENSKEDLRELQTSITKIQGELNDKSDALEESQKQFENIRGQYEQIKSKYNETHKELVEKSDALEVTAAELEDKQREYEELEKVYTQLENSLSDKEKARDLINKEKEHKEKEHNHLKEEHNKLQLIVREKEHAIESRIQELEDKNRQYTQLEDAHNVVLEQVKTLKKTIETKEKELADLNTKYKQERESSAAFQDDVEEKVKEVEEMVKAMGQLKGAYDKLQVELQNKTNALENMKEDLENAERTHRHEVTTLKAQMEHHEHQHHGQIKEARDENNQLQHTLQAKEQEIKTRDLEISGLKRKIESLQGELTLEKQRRDDMEVKHREELDQVEKEANERVGMNMEAISEKEKELKDKHKEAKKKIAELQEENDDLQGQIRGLKVDLDNLGQSLTGRINELNKTVQEANNEYDHMKTELEKEIEERIHKIAGLEGEINALKDSVREKEQEIVNLTRKAKEEAHTAKSETDQKLREKDEHAQSLEGEVGTLQNKKKELNEAVEGLKKHVDELKTTYEKDLSDRDTRITALEGETADLKKKLTAKESEVTQLTGQVDNLHKSKAELSALHDSTKKSSEEASQTTGEKINSLESQVAALKKEIGEKSDEITNLKKSGSQEVTQIREDYEGHITKLKSEIEALNGQVASNKALYEEHAGKLSKLQSEHNELTQKLNGVQTNLEASKTEAGNLKESLTQKTKESDELKTRLEEANADRETLRQNVQELTNQKADYGSQLEKIGSDKGSLETKYQSIRDEKRSLEKTVSQLKQDLNNLTSSQVQNDQKTSEDLRQKNAIISSFSESFEELQKSQILKGKIDSRFQDKSQVGEAIQVLRGSLESKDEEIKKLTQEVQNLEALKKEAESSYSTLVSDSERKLQDMKKEAETSYSTLVSETEKRLQDLNTQLTEKFNKEREDLQNTVKITKEDMEQRLLKLSLEIEDIFKSASLEFKPVSEEVKQKASVSEAEQTIHDYLSSLKNHIITLEQVKKDYQTAEEESKATAKQLDEFKIKSGDLEKLQQTLEGEKKQLQTELQTLKDTYKEREGEIEKLRETLEKKANKDKPSDFDLPSVDITEDFDENQIKKLMEDTFKVERKGDDRSDVEGGTQNIRYTLPVQEEIRELKDENERLDLEYRQLRSQHDLLLEVNEELKSEVNEKEDEVKKMEYQMAVLKEEFAKMEREKNQTTIAHEKQHIRMMFIKFMESALAGTKEAPELLKYLLALLDLSEANKNQIMESFKAKTVKKSGFKVFT